MPTHLLAVFVVILLGFSGSAIAVENNETSEKRTNLTGQTTGERQDAATNGDTNELSEPTVAGADAKRDNARKRAIQKATSRQYSSPDSPQKREGGSESSIDSNPRDQRIKAGSSSSERSRVLTARLKGSLCVSCLFHLERKIQALEGVTSAHIIRPAKVVDPVAEHPAYAQVQIIYNASKWNPKSIRSFIHRNDFDIKDEQDIELTADFKPLPDPNPLSELQKNIGGVVNAQMKPPD